MKKIIFIIGLLLSVNSFASKGITLRSFSPDAMNLTQGDEVTIEISYYESGVGSTNQFISTDTFRVYVQHVNNDQSVSGLKEIYKIAILDIKDLPKNTDGYTTLIFNVPDTYKPGNSEFIYSFSNDRTTAFINPKTTTSIINPLEEKNYAITYYSIQGLEIEKPSNGLYIWKASNGESGKIYTNE